MPEDRVVPDLPDGVEIATGMVPTPIFIRGKGVAFSREPDGSVEIAVEYPDGTWANWNSTAERYITIPRDAWEAIVAYVSLALDENQHNEGEGHA